MEESQNKLRLVFWWLKKAALKIGLYIDEDKTEYMVVGRQDTTRIYLILKVKNRSYKKNKKWNNLNTYTIGLLLSKKNEIE